MLSSIQGSRFFKWSILIIVIALFIGLVKSVINTVYEQQNRAILTNFKKDVEKQISNPGFYRNIDSLIRAGAYDKAINLTKIRIANYPEDGAILFNQIGYIYFTKGDLVSAISAYNEAINICDTLLVAYQNRGWAYLQMNKFDLAIRDFKIASILDVQTRYLLGLAFEKKGNISEAIKSFTLYLKYYPEDSSCRLKLDSLKLKLKTNGL